MPFQLIVYAHTKITKRLVLHYEFAAEQQKKEHKQGTKIFLYEVTTSRNEPVKGTETRAGMITQENYPTTGNRGKERIVDYSTSAA